MVPDKLPVLFPKETASGLHFTVNIRFANLSGDQRNSLRLLKIQKKTELLKYERKCNNNNTSSSSI